MNYFDKIFNLSTEFSSKWDNPNQIKSFVLRLLNYLKAGNYNMVNNEILRILIILDLDPKIKEEFLDSWQKYIKVDNQLFEKAVYSFIAGVIKGQN